MKKRLSRRIIKVEGVDQEFYPIKKDALVPFTDHLIVQALFGAKVQADLIASTKGLKELIKDLTAEGKENGYVTMFGGRRVQVRHAHATLNSQLQGMGAEAMKHYLVFFHKECKVQGLEHGKHYKQEACIYDEVDLIVRDDKVAQVADILQTTYKKVSDHLGMKCMYTGEVLIGGQSPDKYGPNGKADNSWQGCH